MPNILTVNDVRKNYGQKEVLKGVSLNIHRGEIYGLLGLNGAGKTTLLEIIEHLRYSDSGFVNLQGTMGVQLQFMNLPSTIKVKEALEMVCIWKHIKFEKEKFMPLISEDYMNMQYQKLSGGWKSRLHIAMAICGDPDLLILDEPTTGLDIEGRYYLYDIIKSYKTLGKSVLFSTHEVPTVEFLCDRIGVLYNGKISLEGEYNNIVKSSNLTLEEILMKMGGGLE